MDGRDQGTAMDRTAGIAATVRADEHGRVGNLGSDGRQLALCHGREIPRGQLREIADESVAHPAVTRAGVYHPDVVLGEISIRAIGMAGEKYRGTRALSALEELLPEDGINGAFK
jgi:hypothetical protein